MLSASVAEISAIAVPIPAPAPAKTPVGLSTYPFEARVSPPPAKTFVSISCATVISDVSNFLTAILSDPLRITLKSVPVENPKSQAPLFTDLDSAVLKSR